MLNDAEIDQFRLRLLARRGELEETARASAAARKPVELDQSKVGRLSRMDAMQVQAMAVETERRRANELLRIAATLKRIETDEFGYCLRCDEAIDPKRLAFDAAAPLCIDCAQNTSAE